ncbi:MULTISPECIES: hypothetical protein [Enterococcus]|uniref:hypothetical protein n=1 Tax=Enterococcus TaxID=1350 RepID=UPI000E060C59|nr:MULTISPECIES: hypothetical protein [Enterococcus]EGP4841056.1 hypothetical protein [Enterococcus faecium]EJC3739644.1 hypothetical protein [Enterococcus faecium]EKY8175432.1 hypothetical protein [Enterococcus faecium]EMF0278843.1 hypothetical protein [Enterococcus faecium]MDG4567075.1 hypothetical protein [Enterococcus faecium]
MTIIRPNKKRGCEKAALHQVIRTAKQKLLLLFFVWLGLLPQMQAFEHRLLRGCKISVLT